MGAKMKNDQSDCRNCIDLNALPEGCIAKALSLTTPRDACRLSLVASTFRSAALSDDVWERFLPSDYRDILSRSPQGIQLLRSSISRKQLYLYLCDNPILIDGGAKSFSLEKSNGKKCYMLAARDLKIVWGDTPSYWQWISLSNSRFSEVAELLRVYWLEIRGKIKTSMLSPDTTYAAYLVFTWNSKMYGFEGLPTEVEVGISGEEGQKQVLHLNPVLEERQRQQIWLIKRYGHRPPVRIIGEEIRPVDLSARNIIRPTNGDARNIIRPDRDARIIRPTNRDARNIIRPANRDARIIRPINRDALNIIRPDGDARIIRPTNRDARNIKHRVDGWMEVELGEMFIKEGQDVDMEMSLMEIKRGNCKSGLVVQGIEVRPKK